MTQKKRRRVEPTPDIEKLFGAEIHTFGILEYTNLVLPSKYAPETVEHVELPFDISLHTILTHCFSIARTYGIEPPASKVVAQMMRRKGLEPPSEVAPPEEFLRADPKTYITVMFKDWQFGGDRNNWAHPVSQLQLIMFRIGYVLGLRERASGPLMREFLVDLAAGIGVAFGRLEMALRHERDALVGERVRAGNRAALDERARKRRALWTAKLGTAERTGTKLKHGEVERIAGEVALELGTTAAAERRWYERNMRRRPG